MTISRHFAAIAAATATLAVGAPLLARSEAAGTLSIVQPWTRETAPGQAVGGGFMTIANRGSQADRLLSASSPAARQVQIHTVAMDGGIMRMRPLVQGVAIPAGQAVALKPGGYHLMLIGLKQPLRHGTTVPVTLQFQRAGALRVELAVQPIGATGPAQGHDHG